VARQVKWHDSLFSYDINDTNAETKATSFSKEDNAAYCPLGSVVDTAFTWDNDRSPNIPWHQTVIYEVHVKSLTQLHPDIPDHLRGSYAALCYEPIIKHLKKLGVTAVELMPIHHHVNDRHLVDKGFVNFWGYNTLSAFAPDFRYAASNQLGAVQEFKTMVRILHQHNIEVILDVVYNHTAEGNELGPTLSLKGIDNRSYYKLVEGSEQYYFDYTGCGNTLNVRHPRVLQLIMDSLRYWILDMHVDGFRFDLASTLARTFYEVDKLGAFFDIIQQDPVISRVKLIAEPWDLGSGGYQVGNFPVLWTEWNGKYRDTIRAFWNGKGVTLGELAMRITGSSDLYSGDTGRSPHASINFVTCHDGFCLMDLVSYNEKHNSANLEDNRDGNNENLSWNCGIEGMSDDADIVELRWRQRANMLSTLLLSLGVPMIAAGDELSHSQCGNNNPYCQDNEITWLNWNVWDDGPKEDFLQFVQRLIEIRQKQPVLLRRKHFDGKPSKHSGLRDISWWLPDGREPTEKEWNDPNCQSLGYIMEGTSIVELSKEGLRIIGPTLLVLINAQFHDVGFSLPKHPSQHPWKLLLITDRELKDCIGQLFYSGEFLLKHHSLALFQLSEKVNKFRKFSNFAFKRNNDVQ